MGFFQKARGKARTFFNELPQNIGKARSFLNTAVGVTRKGYAIASHVNKGIQTNDVFNDKIKDSARKAQQFADLGLKKVDEYHKGGDKFLEHLQQTPL